MALESGEKPIGEKETQQQNPISTAQNLKSDALPTAHTPGSQWLQQQPWRHNCVFRSHLCYSNHSLSTTASHKSAALPFGMEGLYPQAAGAGVAVRKQYDSQFSEWGSQCPPILTTGLQREGWLKSSEWLVLEGHGVFEGCLLNPGSVCLSTDERAPLLRPNELQVATTHGGGKRPSQSPFQLSLLQEQGPHGSFPSETLSALWSNLEAPGGPQHSRAPLLRGVGAPQPPPLQSPELQEDWSTPERDQGLINPEDLMPSQRR